MLIQAVLVCVMLLCKGFRLAPSAGWYNAAIGSPTSVVRTAHCIAVF